jgi:hypothetical protein
MNARRVLLLILLMTSQILTYAQSSKNNDEFFILGTISDFDGRRQNPDFKNQFDYYYQYEKPVVAHVDSLLKKDYPKQSYDLRFNGNQYEIRSADLLGVFDKYFKYKASSSSTMEHGKIFYGVLKDSIFKTDAEKLAFLAGAYSRFGQARDTAYCIWIACSVSKVSVCNKILKEFNCKPSFQIVNNTPTGVVVYFHPDKKVAAYLEKYNYLRKGVDKELHVMIDSMMTESKKRKALKSKQ